MAARTDNAARISGDPAVRPGDLEHGRQRVDEDRALVVLEGVEIEWREGVALVT